MGQSFKLMSSHRPRWKWLSPETPAHPALPSSHSINSSPTFAPQPIVCSRIVQIWLKLLRTERLFIKDFLVLSSKLFWGPFCTHFSYASGLESFYQPRISRERKLRTCTFQIPEWGLKNLISIIAITEHPKQKSIIGAARRWWRHFQSL